MTLLLPALAALVGCGAGAVAGANQHLLYRQAEFRAAPSRGGSAAIRRVALVLAVGATSAIAFRWEHYDFGPALLTALFACGLLVLASTDFERRLLPNRLLYPLLLAALLFCWAWPDRTVGDVVLGITAAGVAGLAIFLLGLILGGPVGGLGIGDIKLMVLIGALTGWPAVMSALVFGVLLGGVPALFLIVTRRGRSYFSYGPYLVLGALVVLLLPDAFV